VDDRPNVILLLVDTLRADHLGAYGFVGDISPGIDRLANESVLFENCYANAPWTPPSVATLFTSLYPQVHGLNRFADHKFRDPVSGSLRASVLPDEAVTLAEVLRDAGYRTAAIVANPWLKRKFGLGQGFDVYLDDDLGKRTPASLITVPAREWLEANEGAEPFFLYLHFMDVHEPYDSSREDFDAVWAEPPAASERFLDEPAPDYLERKPSWADDALRERAAYWKARYAAGVRTFDRRITGFLEDLGESGLLDRSYLILTSDHGEELYEHGGWGHGESLHEHQLRVPLLVRPPGGVPAPRRVGDTVRLLDLMPTILSIARAEVPAALQGADLSPLLRGEPGAQTEEVFATGVVSRPEAFSIRVGRYKLIADRGSASSAVYDLFEDPGETVDVSEREADIEAALLADLERHLVASGAELERRTTELPEEIHEELKALGYLD